MTQPIGGVNPQGQPAQAQQAQKPQLSEQELQALQNAGIDPAKVTGPEQLEGKVDVALIQKMFPAYQPAATVVKGGQQLQGDQAEFKGKEPTEQDKIKRENEKFKHETDKQFIADAKAYSEADLAFQQKQNEVNELRAQYNTLMKKTMKSTVKIGDKKVDKDEAREAAKQALDKAENELVALGKERDKAKAKLGTNLDAANQFNMDEAKDAEAKKQAAMRDARDYFTTDKGRQAVEDNLVHTEDGTALVGKEGKAHKRGSAERAAAYDAIQAEYEKNGQKLTRRGARRIYKARVKDYNSMTKEDALNRIVIGDKDAYKKAVEEAKSKNKFDKDKPSITYMSEELYGKAQKFAKARGLELPSLEEAKSKGLTGDQLKQFQQILMDEAGDVGSRLDAKERKQLDKDFKDISYKDFRQMFTAGNVDVQKTYTTAAEVAGAAAGAATALATGVYDAGSAGFSLGLSGLTGGMGAGSSIVDKGADWVPGTAGKFKLGNAALAVLVDRAVAEGIKAVANYDPNAFKKGVTLEKYVYDQLDSNDAFKKIAPNVKKTMAKIMSNKDLTNDQKYALCERALGDANERLNLREAVGADASAKALQKRERQEIPQDDIIPELQKRQIYDIGGGRFVDAEGNEVDMSNADYIRDGAVTDDKARAVGSRATAYDEKVVHQKHHNNDDFNRADTMKTIDETTGDIANKNHTGSWQQVKSQYVVSDNQGEVEVRMGNSKDVKAPDSLVLKDNTNGVTNTYEYEKLTPSEIKELKLDPEKGPYYKVVKAIDGDNGKEITQAKGKVFRLDAREVARGETYQSTEKDGYVDSRTQSKISQINYHMDAVTQEGSSSAVFVKVFKNK